MIGYIFDLSMDIMYPGLIAWDIIMPISSILIAILFKRAQKKQQVKRTVLLELDWYGIGAVFSMTYIR
jgi:hypothetical protein